MKDMYNTYDDEYIPYDYPVRFPYNNFDYLQGNLPTYDIDYGDTTELPFCIAPEFRDSSILITIYNFRYEIVYQVYKTVAENDCKVYLTIDSDLATKLIKGIYYVKLQAVKMEDDNEHMKVCTILPTSACSIHIN